MARKRSLAATLLLVLLVFALVWFAVLASWQASHRVPSGLEAGLYLLGLPLGLLAAYAGLHRGIDAVRRRRAATPAEALAAAETPAEAVDATLAWQWPIIAADAILPAGVDPAAALEALRAGQRVGLHPTLQDAAGLPVFAAEITAVDLDAEAPGIDAALPAATPAQRRTLALGAHLLLRLLDTHGEPWRHAAGHGAAAPAGGTLALTWLLPADWDAAAREAARRWLLARLEAERWPPARLCLGVRPVADGLAAWDLLDELHRQAHADPAAGAQLLLASGSAIDAATLADWAARGELYASARREGRVPGEGAAAVLFGAVPDAPAIARLGRVFRAARERAVELPQRLDTTTLSTLHAAALAQVAVPADAPWQLLADSGFAASRGAEALGFAQAALPERDPVEALAALGVANGDAGAPLALAQVALAAQRAAAEAAPAVLFSNHDPRHRALLLVTPVPAATPEPFPQIA